MADGTGRDRSGLGPGKRKERGARELRGEGIGFTGAVKRRGGRAGAARLLLCPGASSERRESRGRAERGKWETEGEKEGSRYAGLGRKRDGSGRHCLAGQGAALAAQRGAGPDGAGTGSRRLTTAATARARAREVTARGELAGDGAGRENGITREREGELSSSSAHAHAHAHAAHGQSEGRAEGERERERWAERKSAHRT
uniref:Uncharacterized protein n=1 Tax=Oryza sativa subsp. japonica TaxID=39947 RepID=Q69XK2_ORYSJ|nr:hypothetical protein [Oryza sativa Japonica Group]BAD35455.1 hypothetical protein [Oryza sativa Japonica Group]